MIPDEDALSSVLHQSCGEPQMEWKDCDYWYRHITDARNVGYYLRYSPLAGAL